MTRVRRKFLIICLAVFVLISFPLTKQVSSYFEPTTANGKYVLLRLEDVGPGGFYGTPEGLGKLRAVFDYLGEQNIPYHITVVSRWKTYQENKGWVEAGIDTPTPLTESFVKILKQAQSSNAVLGMHGYSHQFGDTVRSDGQHNSGFANEFKIKGEPVTETKEYAAERIEKSLNAFEKNGLFPAFWESPHYHSTLEQQKVFRSYMGIIYEPNWFELRSLKDIVYSEEENQWKQQSLGAVYVPAPLKYVVGEQSIGEILTKLKENKSLGSMYFHPFLEFDYFEPVIENGHPVVRDGIPVFRYKAGNHSLLHQLVEGIKQTGRTFGTIHDVVPFTPANRVRTIPGLQTDQLLAADVNGDKKQDWIALDQTAGKIQVTLSDIKWPRNTVQPSLTEWLDSPSLKQKGVLLPIKRPETERSDLLWISNGNILLFSNEGGHFSQTAEQLPVPDRLQLVNGQNLTETWKWTTAVGNSNSNSRVVAFNASLHKALVFEIKTNTLQLAAETNLPENITGQATCTLTDVNKDKFPDLIINDPVGEKIWVLKGTNSGFDKPEHWFEPHNLGLATIGDTNGDGMADVVFYNEKEGIWQVVRSGETRFEQLAAAFGPWGSRIKGTMLVGDWDGNGKSDIAIYNKQTGTIDTALSFQTR